ncbi:hypothetical protein PMAYCL1PPCAC_16558 [Pristionchus mayeri]|uniref:Long-chain-fatty-acid--CoA ligase n=1 Tax=Pristionchus mayeri TaxID=1317129 RepID=A0AAN5HZD5_9BILA|nr:hypothetical protein PMAYCL1PPCAC_16558 [Pristionchus mayeri]
MDMLNRQFELLKAMNDRASIALAAAAAVATVGLGYYLTRKTHIEGRIEPLVDPLDQTIKLPDGSRISRFKSDGVLLKRIFSDATTLYEAIRRGARIFKNKPMLGRRVKQADGSEPYVWLSYEQVLARIDNVAVAFRELGLPTGEETLIGIYSKNRVEWVITEYATYSYSNVIVPLYDTLGPDACTFIIHQSEIKIVVCDESTKALGLLEQRSQCPSLSILVVVERPSTALKAAAQEAGVGLLAFEELEELGKNAKHRPPHVKPTPDSLATICYTSGTTGTPKGVMLTHGNVIADATTVMHCRRAFPTDSDVMISFLPLGHMFERTMECIMYSVGARVGFYRGDIKLLFEDLQELQPTIMPVVPRVLNKLYDKVMSGVNSSLIKRILFNAALSYKKREMANFVIRQNSFYDKIVFKKIREALGGKVKLMITGSAPLEKEVLTFVRAALGCTVMEGYGQTECVAGATISIEGDAVPGHVGMPIPCLAIKLVDVPELGYFARNDAGEVCVRGYAVFRGYYKNEEQTREVLDGEGWLHTGDIGRWTKQGCLEIVDRKKHIFKLAQGEYVAPEKVECVYARSRFVAQSFVYGESLKASLIAIVVPDPEVLVPAMKSLGVTGTVGELCARDDVKMAVMDDMMSTGKAAGLCSFEQVKDIYLMEDPFSVENGLLTPTLKSKRVELKKRFGNLLATMYSNLD